MSILTYENINQIVSLGFKESDAINALNREKTVEGAISWLVDNLSLNSNTVGFQNLNSESSVNKKLENSRFNGEIKFLDDEKAFGFIHFDSSDIFFHYSDKMNHNEIFEIGDETTFSIGENTLPGKNNGRICAKEVSLKINNPNVAEILRKKEGIIVEINDKFGFVQDSQTQCTYMFYHKDIIESININIGDKVLFLVKVSKINNFTIQKAVQIEYKRPKTAPENHLPNQINQLIQKNTSNTFLNQSLNLPLNHPSKNNQIHQKMADLSKPYLNRFEIFPHDESRIIEFKALTKTSNILQRLLELSEKYIVAFLNAEGGKTLFGILDNGMIVGLKLQRKLRDEIRLGIDGCVSRIRPKVTNDMVRVDFLPVLSNTHNLIDFFVVSVECKRGTEIYLDGEKQAWIRREGSVAKMDIEMVLAQHEKKRKENKCSQDDEGNSKNLQNLIGNAIRSEIHKLNKKNAVSPKFSSIAENDENIKNIENIENYENNEINEIFKDNPTISPINVLSDLANNYNSENPIKNKPKMASQNAFNTISLTTPKKASKKVDFETPFDLIEIDKIDDFNKMSKKNKIDNSISLCDLSMESFVSKKGKNSEGKNEVIDLIDFEEIDLIEKNDIFPKNRTNFKNKTKPKNVIEIEDKTTKNISFDSKKQSIKNLIDIENIKIQKNDFQKINQIENKNDQNFNKNSGKNTIKIGQKTEKTIKINKIDIKNSENFNKKIINNGKKIDKNNENNENYVKNDQKTTLNHSKTPLDFLNEDFLVNKLTEQGHKLSRVLETLYTLNKSGINIHSEEGYEMTCKKLESSLRQKQNAKIVLKAKPINSDYFDDFAEGKIDQNSVKKNQNKTKNVENDENCIKNGQNNQKLIKNSEINEKNDENIEIIEKGEKNEKNGQINEKIDENNENFLKNGCRKSFLILEENSFINDKTNESENKLDKEFIENSIEGKQDEKQDEFSETSFNEFQLNFQNPKIENYQNGELKNEIENNMESEIKNEIFNKNEPFLENPEIKNIPKNTIKIKKIPSNENIEKFNNFEESLKSEKRRLNNCDENSLKEFQSDFCNSDSGESSNEESAEILSDDLDLITEETQKEKPRHTKHRKGIFSYIDQFNVVRKAPPTRNQKISKNTKKYSKITKNDKNFYKNDKNDQKSENFDKIRIKNCEYSEKYENLEKSEECEKCINFNKKSENCQNFSKNYDKIDKNVKKNIKINIKNDLNDDIKNDLNDDIKNAIKTERFKDDNDIYNVNHLVYPIMFKLKQKYASDFTFKQILLNFCCENFKNTSKDQNGLSTEPKYITTIEGGLYSTLVMFRLNGEQNFYRVEKIKRYSISEELAAKKALCSLEEKGILFFNIKKDSIKEKSE